MSKLLNSYTPKLPQKYMPTLLNSKKIGADLTIRPCINKPKS